jgi:hypothetical protein
MAKHAFDNRNYNIAENYCLPEYLSSVVLFEFEELRKPAETHLLTVYFFETSIISVGEYFVSIKTDF